MLALHVEEQIKRALQALPPAEATKVLLEFPELPADFVLTPSLSMTYQQALSVGAISMCLLGKLETYPAAKAIFNEETSLPDFMGADDIEQ